MQMPHSPSFRPLRLLLVALVALAVLAGTVPAAGSGAVDKGTHPLLGSATLPLRGPQHSGVALQRGPGKAVRARYAILADPETGAVLWGRRSRTSVPPASLTKMLTALAVR